MISIQSDSGARVRSILKWFFHSIEHLDQFGEYDQLQLISCAHELNYEHPNIVSKLEKVASKSEAGSTDYVFQFLEQLVLMKYQIGVSRQKKYFEYWLQEENLKGQSELTKAYHSGYLVMEENKLSSPELKQKAIQWLSQASFLPSMSLTAWTVSHLERFGKLEEAKSRFDELISVRLENGSWNNFPFQTIQIAHPLSLTAFGNHPVLERTTEFILNQPWDGFSGDIRYETGLLKWLMANNFIEE